jgi:hypothetical protein
LNCIFSLGSVFPHHLSYFNAFVGGPRNGHHHLLGSSFDWGQDWFWADQWLYDQAARKRNGGFVGVGRHRPSWILKSANRFSGSPEVLLVSRSILMGDPESVCDLNGIVQSGLIDPAVCRLVSEPRTTTVVTLVEINVQKAGSRLAECVCAEVRQDQ